MNIETTLTLIVAAAILVGAVLIRMSVVGAIRLFVIVREWVRPAPARHRISRARVTPARVAIDRS